MATQQPARRKMQPTAQVSIPDKLYFRIGNVARLCSLPAYVLRFWETEFPQLKPNKGGTGQRLYRKRDVEIVLEIKHLLYEEGFTIAGARRLMAENRRMLHAERDQAPVAALKVSKTQQPSNGVKEAPAPARRSASEVLQPPAKPKAAPSNPRLKDIRKEMKELLALLGAEDAASSAMQAPPKRGTKKNHPADDAPTLF